MDSEELSAAAAEAEAEETTEETLLAAEEEEEAEDDEEEEEDEEDEGDGDDDVLVLKAQGLMDKVTSNPDRPNPKTLHALASLLEAQESKYMDEIGYASFNNDRASHNIGRLGNSVRDNDEFFELISEKYLKDSTFTISVQAAALRILLACSLTWMYPHIFEVSVLENLKKWVIDETPGPSEKQVGKNESGIRQSTDSEMLKTYSTGLLAVCLSGGGDVVDNVLTTGIPSKLMRDLRIRILGEASLSQRVESRTSAVVTSIKPREEGGRVRFRQVSETCHLDTSRIEEGTLDDEGERSHVRSLAQPSCADDHWDDDFGELPEASTEDVNNLEGDADSGRSFHGLDLRDRNAKIADRTNYTRYTCEGDFDGSVRDDSAKRKANHRLVRTRGKGRSNEGSVENDQCPGSESRFELSSKDRSSFRHLDSKVTQADSMKRLWGRTSADGVTFEKDDNDECFQECKVGSKDISYLVKMAVRAAEAEARAANAPIEALKAAGDAAAEVVKTAALEEFTKTNDEDAAVLAASKAASTVIDAANAVDIARSKSNVDAQLTSMEATEFELIEEPDEFFIPDSDSLASLREQFSIQCLVILGEYMEVLGPVLHERAVDVCVGLLQKNSTLVESSKVALVLPDVLKLICALAAHRKFAALFVDRGGIQKLLAVPRVPLTFFGLSSCLFAIGSLQGVMERVCALPSDIVHQLIGLALQLLECAQDQARKNAAQFFIMAFVFRAVLDSFDSQDGLQKLLNLLRGAASVRSGGVSNAGAVGPSASTSGSLRNDGSPPEVLTSSEKQIAYHTSCALHQYFKAHLLLLVDSVRPNKSSRSAARNIPSVKAANKPLDISNEAMDVVFRQIQKDRKIGPAFVRARWPVVDKFLSSNGHIIMLELCQAPPVERYLRDLVQYALGVLHIATLVPYGRKFVVNATLSNDRLGIAVILDAANGAGVVEPDIIKPALNLLVNLVCPPPSISIKPTLTVESQPSAVQTSAFPGTEMRERNAERNVADQSAQNEPRDRNGDTIVSASNVMSGLVGDRRISLGPGAGCAGLAAQLEQGYHQAREAVRANNGIKVLLQLLQPRIITPPVSLDCLRALACRVLLGLARDDTIAHILTKLQVGKKLSELIRDSGSQTPVGEQGRWQSELSQVAIELIAIVTNSGRASTLAATDAATPTLRRIERAAIAAATPITYHSRDLLLLIHEHLQASGLTTAAAALKKEAQLTPLPFSSSPSLPTHEACGQETSTLQFQFPSGRSPSGLFMSEKSKQHEDSTSKLVSTLPSSKKKPLLLSPAVGVHPKVKSQCNEIFSPSSSKVNISLRKPSAPAVNPETPSSTLEALVDPEGAFRTPIILPMKRKLTEFRDAGSSVPGKRLNTSERDFHSPVFPMSSSARKGNLLSDINSFKDPSLNENQILTSHVAQGTPSHNHGYPNDPQISGSERLTLDSIVHQYLKHQHRQCPAPITTLPPLSLLHPHTCPEPKQRLDTPFNITARLGTREFKSNHGGICGGRRDRHFVYSRFRPWRTCRDDVGVPLTCISFLGDSSQIAVGSHSGELKIFESNTNNLLESSAGHQYPLTIVQSYFSGDTQLILSSSSHDVRLWDAPTVGAGPKHSFEDCKAAKFNNSGTMFAALSSDTSRREILLYDLQTCKSDLNLTDTSSSTSSKGSFYSLVHFSPSDIMLLWNGVLWDRRVPGHVHRFDQFTDYGGGGFHPAGNEVIINSEVWDLRNFRLLRSVPSLNQTTITFNASGDVIYAILRRNLDDVNSAFVNRRMKHPLFSAFRTIDAVNYSDIATTLVERCVLDFATEPTDSFVGLITMDDQEEMYSSARIYEIGRRKPTDDDSDPDDAETEEDDDDDDDDDEDIEVDPLLGDDGDGESDADDDMSNGENSSSEDDDERGDTDFIVDGVDFDDGDGLFEILSEGEEDDDDEMLESFSSGDDEDFLGDGF